MIPLSVLARNQTKGFGLEISGDRKWVREHEKRVGQRSSRKAVSDGRWTNQSTPEQRDQSNEMRSRAVREVESDQVDGRKRQRRARGQIKSRSTEEQRETVKNSVQHPS